MKSTFGNIILSAIISFAASTSMADNLVSVNHLNLSIGTVDYDYGYLRENANLSGTRFEANGNFNYMPQVDIIANAGISSVDKTRNSYKFDLRVIDVWGGARYFFKAKNKFNPYAGGGLHYVNWSAKVKSDLVGFTTYDDDDSEIGLFIDGGIEIDFAPRLFTRFGGTLYTADFYDGIELTTLVGWAFTSDIYGTLNVKLGLNDRPDTILVGVLMKL